MQEAWNDAISDSAHNILQLFIHIDEMFYVPIAVKMSEA